MNNVRRFFTLAIPLVVFLMGLGTGTAVGQINNIKVNGQVDFTDYDVIYLTDWVDIKSQSLKESIPNFSLSMSVDSANIPYTKPLEVCFYIRVDVQIRGEASTPLLEGVSKNFKITGTRMATAREFAGKNSNSDIDLRGKHYENKDLRKKIEDRANLYTTAPSGTYRVFIEINPPYTGPLTSTTFGSFDAARGSRHYGSISKSITVQLETPNVFTELIEPKKGIFTNSLTPTFSWTTQAPRTTLRVYEVLCNHLSPTDAMTGTPYLTQDVSGVTTLTYPASASRQLQQDRAYVWVVDGIVTTSRNPDGVRSSSQPFVFRVTDDKVGTMLDNFFSQLGGPGQALYSNLRTDPNYWVYLSNCSRATLDGKTLTEGDLQSTLNELSGMQDNNLQVSVENQ